MSSRVMRALDPSYEEVLAAVQETDRGRWFLAEYRNRASQPDLQAILAAISRIEAHLASLPPSQSQNPEWLAARKAIINARADILGLLPPGSEPTSEEEAFARLAALARAAFSGPFEAPAKPAVLRALKLVQDLEGHLETGAAPAHASTPESDRFFARDSELFVAPAKPVAERSPETSRGARLVVIHSTDTRPEGCRELTVMPVDPPPSAPSNDLPSQPQTMDNTPQGRITVIRRLTGEAAGPPLLNEAATGPAA